MKINDFVTFEMSASLDVPRCSYMDKDNYQIRDASGVWQRSRVVDQNEFGFVVPYFRKDGTEVMWQWPVNSYDIARDGAHGETFPGFIQKV